MTLPAPQTTFIFLPHAQDAQNLALRIMSQPWRRRLSPPNPLPQRHHTRIEIPQRSQEQENRRISRRVVSEFRYIRDADGRVAGCAGVNIHLVVAGAIVAAESERSGQGGDELGVPEAGEGDAGKSHEGCDHAVESAGGAFLEEGGAVS